LHRCMTPKILVNMNFRTELEISESPQKISLQTPVLTIGSCFAEVIGGRLVENKIPTLSNPFGTIFNPVSMAKLLTQAAKNQPPDNALYVEHQGVWFHYDFHSSLWGHSREELAEQLIQKLQEVRDWLQKTNVLVVTFGTAYVYRHLETQAIVANCHKTPASFFQKELLTTHAVVEAFQNLPMRIPHTIFTVSPVRHTRDTLPLNAVSKAILRVACHELTANQAHNDYFPAYELLLDDLRDYRFYKPDLIHPSEVAEDYIFEKFGEAYFTPNLQAFMTEWQKIRQALAHRPLQPNTLAHRKFLENLLSKLLSVGALIDVHKEISQIEEQLESLG
jgi:hypothetical protein